MKNNKRVYEVSARPAYLWALVLLLITANSCREKDNDETYPTIQIATPAQGRIHHYGDDISITASVQDEKQLKSIEVAITDRSGNKFLQTETFSPSGATFDVNVTISHNDLYLSGGTYYVRIRASDGENEQFAFREIQLTEAPRQIEKLFVARDTGGSCSIDSMSGTSLLPYFQYAHEYFAGGVNARSNQLVIGSIHPGEMQSFLYPEFETVFASFPPSNDIITAFHHDTQNQCFYWGTLSGAIWKTDIQGTRLFTSTYNGRITSLGSGAERVIAASENVNQKFVSTIRSDNGFVETTLTIDWQIKSILKLVSENDRILLIGNEEGASHFAWLNLSTSAINEVYNFYETSMVKFACNGPGNDFYVIHTSGIVRYANTMSSFTTNSIQGAEKLVYDEIGNTVWAVGTQTLTHLDGGVESVIQSYPISGLKDFWIKYNK